MTDKFKKLAAPGPLCGRIKVDLSNFSAVALNAREEEDSYTSEVRQR